ncbi:MAG: hypothetical protein KDK39_00640 [Leptospiraceae bacterium]|nr:hypothetical protein [Leptospiraceae bacterium]
MFACAYLLINTLFAALYYVGGDTILHADPDSFWQAFVFSFQTSTTIGYGYYLPKNNFAHVVVILDSISGILFVAIATGLAFAKFSRPTARVMFSRNMIVTRMDDQPVLMFRMGNARNGQIIDANVKVVVTIPQITKEGQNIRRVYDLKLVRNNSPLFSIGWTVMHTIDADSPIFGFSESEISNRNITFVISLTGIDEVFSQTVYDRHIYQGDEIQWHKHFVDVIETDAKGNTVINYHNFHKWKDM